MEEVRTKLIKTATEYFRHVAPSWQVRLSRDCLSDLSGNYRCCLSVRDCCLLSWPPINTTSTKTAGDLGDKGLMCVIGLSKLVVRVDLSSDIGRQWPPTRQPQDGRARDDHRGNRRSSVWRLRGFVNIKIPIFLKRNVDVVASDCVKCPFGITICVWKKFV